MSEQRLAEVVPLYETNLRDIPAMMRKVADEIERGDYGDVADAVFVLFGSEEGLHVFGWGAQDDASSHLLLTAGALRLAREVEKQGRTA